LIGRIECNARGNYVTKELQLCLQPLDSLGEQGRRVWIFMLHAIRQRGETLGAQHRRVSLQCMQRVLPRGAFLIPQRADEFSGVAEEPAIKSIESVWLTAHAVAQVVEQLRIQHVIEPIA
jgi:hypothetical protein